MRFTKAIIKYDDKTEEFPINKMTFYEELYVDFKMKEEQNVQKFQMAIHPKKSIAIQQLELHFELAYIPSEQPKIFCNGYQSWSESREYGLEEQMSHLNSWFAKPYKYYGDGYISEIPRGKNIYHSWTYTYLRLAQSVSLIASLKEDTAFTYFIHDTQNNKLIVRKDLSGLQLKHSFPVLDLIVAKGEESKVFQQWFDNMEITPLKHPPATGWTSWYHYYTDISEQIILENLEAFQKENVAIDHFQIDDGYQTKVGDWLNIKSSFPNGMAHLAQKIKQANYKSGIWIAPFVCEADSDIFKQKKHWLLKDNNGLPISLGKIKLWSGDFYALDFYQKEVQEYIGGVLYTFINKWGFEMIKMDFLYAVCIQTPPNKTRGQVMHDAMQFLRNIVGDTAILGCGVPLGSAFGMVDYCRIGANVHLKWTDWKLKFLGHRERISTLASLRSTLGRWQLNNNVFHNNPDVFILRKEANQLTSTQQYTLLVINSLLGNLVFTSDKYTDYSEEQKAEYEFVNYLQGSQVKSVKTINKNHYIIKFENGGMDFATLCNLGNKRASFLVEKNNIELEPFESIILKV